MAREIRRPTAVIDIGSNSSRVLVATVPHAGELRVRQGEHAVPVAPQVVRDRFTHRGVVFDDARGLMGAPSVAPTR